MGVGRRIKGIGPLDARIMVIGEHGGRDEARTGLPFSPKRGRENDIDRFFDGVRLPQRDECYFTYLVREWCGDDADYVQADYDRDLPDLLDEIRAVQPEVIVALGREVNRLFLGDIDLDETHGIQWVLPVDAQCADVFTSPEGVVIASTYNPAAGFRSPELSAKVTYDFQQLEAYLAGELTARRLYDDILPHPDYRELTTLDDVDAQLSAGGQISSDTEGYPHAPWSVQGCSRIGTAWIIRYSRRDLIQRFADWVNGHPSLYRFTFHNSLHDLSVFRALGIDTRGIAFDDTMIAAYNLQIEPQGLKPLCVRHCGMSMQSFDDVMGDAPQRLAQDWLLSAYEVEEYEYEQRRQAEFVRLTTTPYTNKAGKVLAGRRLKVAPKLPKGDLHKAIERCLRSNDPRKLWGDQTPDRQVTAERLYGPIWVATLDHVDAKTALHYAGRDADGTHRLYPILRQRLGAAGLLDTYTADLGTVPLIDRMGQIGILPDQGHFRSLSVDLEAHYLATLDSIRDRTGNAGFNPNSTLHVGDLLFTQFGLPELKYTPGGDPSTNDKILEALEKDHRTDKVARQLIADIREYRETYKLKHTFVDAIPDFVNRWPFDSRIHATFRITRVVTGRLACSDPNLLAMPKHGKFAQRFREGFICGDGHFLGSWDLSQIELRVLAHLSQDPVLLRAFRTGEDLHAQLAVRIFGGKESDHRKGTSRLAAKAINFGIPMGMTNVGLCIELKKNGVDVDENDAQRWLTETMRLYERVPEYQDAQIALALRQGFVTSLLGRRRYIGGIRSSDQGVRAEAERFAFSTPIQASAQDVMHIAEAHIWKDIILPRQRDGQWIEPIIQVHDDVILEFEEGIESEVNDQMIWAMTQTFDGLSIPVETSGDYGHSWGNLTPFQ